MGNSDQLNTVPFSEQVPPRGLREGLKSGGEDAELGGLLADLRNREVPQPVLFTADGVSISHVVVHREDFPVAHQGDSAPIGSFQPLSVFFVVCGVIGFNLNGCHRV